MYGSKTLSKRLKRGRAGRRAGCALYLAGPAVLLLLACSHSPTMLPTDSRLAPLEWLIGEWVSEGERSITYESWEQGGDGSLQGVGRSKSRESGEIRVTETLRLIVEGGEILYVPTVDHNPGPVAFRLVQRRGDDFVFENPEHDFPRRIVYRKLADDRMRVTVSGDDGSGFSIEFQRTAAN